MISAVSSSFLHQSLLHFGIVLLQVRFGLIFVNNPVLGYL